MSKRRADKQLTQDNWDDENDSEDDSSVNAGRSNTASQEVISGRVIKKARRRINRDSNQHASGQAGSQSSAPFAMFTGFSAIGSTGTGTGDKSTATPIKFGATSSGSFKLETSGVAGGASAKTPTDNPFAFLATLNATDASLSSTATKTGAVELSATSATVAASSSSQPRDNGRAADTGVSARHEYERQLRALNKCALRWIERHSSPQSPACVLTPVFDDYAKHLANITAKYEALATGTVAPPVVSKVNHTPAFNLTGGGSGGGAATAAGFGAGFFGFQNKTATTPLTSVGTAAPAVPTDTAEDGEEPPVPVVSVVEESDALYSQRCKLFYKKDGEFVEKGVGQLHLKPCSDGKTQLLVRADTNLGNILLNIKLNQSIPTQRMGRNNVMLACVPNPPLELQHQKKDDQKEGDDDEEDEEAAAAPVSLLIRVKTAEDADRLLDKLQQLKKGC